MWPRLLRPARLLCFWTRAASGLALCRWALTTLTSARRPGDVGLTLTSAILLGLPCCEVDLLARLQADIGLFPVPAAADETTETLFLALHVGDLDAFHLHLEQQLDRSLDLGLGGIRRNTEDHLLILVGHEGALFRDL